MTDDKRTTCLDTKQIWIDGQICRGRFLDAFARLEAAVMDYAVKLDLKVTPGMPFSQKLKKLSAARERFVHPKRLDDRIAVIGRLNEVRADLVHSVLTVMVQHNETSILAHWLGFQNACHAEKPLRMITSSDLEQMAAEVGRLGNQFSHQKLKAATPTAPASSTARAA